MFSLLLILITYAKCEHQITAEHVPTYLEGQMITVEEEIFPRNIAVNVSFTLLRGTLLYSIDKNNNQLIISASNGFESVLTIEFRGEQSHILLKDLCGCTECRYIPLWINLTITSTIDVQCNDHKSTSLTYNKEKKIDRDYPMVDFKSPQGNSARFWLVNFPQTGKAHSNPEQMQGCVFFVRYNGEVISLYEFPETTRAICPQTCGNNFCNGGRCLETYLKEPVCDCSSTFGSGLHCKNEGQQINAKEHGQFQFSSIKISWQWASGDIFEIGSSKTKLVVRQKNFNVDVYVTVSGNTTKRTIFTGHKQDERFVLIILFGKDITFKMMLPVPTSHVVNQGAIDSSKEIFTYINIHSGDGVMDVAYKSVEIDIPWKRLILNNLQPETTTASTATTSTTSDTGTHSAIVTKMPFQKDAATESIYASLNDIRSILVAIIVIVVIMFVTTYALSGFILYKLYQLKNKQRNSMADPISPNPYENIPLNTN